MARPTLNYCQSLHIDSKKPISLCIGTNSHKPARTLLLLWVSHELEALQ
jgi:hypothetical protein